MAVAAPAGMSYEDYLAEGETNWRYDIIDGVRVNMPSPTPYHQKVAQRITRLLEDYEVETGSGVTLAAPCDVRISLFPLRTRQPDVMFVSFERLRGQPLTAPPPLEAAPELVIEVIPDSDRQRVLAAKIADFISIGVDECWTVRPDDRTVTVLRLTSDGPEEVATYSDGETVLSETLPGLALRVDDVFNFYGRVTGH